MMEEISLIDERAYRVLYVDDERPNLQAISYALSDHLNIDVAGSAEQAIRMIREHEYAVLLADQRMPMMTGVELCEVAAEISPATVRMIYTAYKHHESVVAAIERGRVSRYLLKPVRNEDLLEALRFGIHHFHARKMVEALQQELVESAPAHLMRAARSDVAHQVGNMLSPLALRLEAVARLTRDLPGLDPVRADVLRDAVFAARLVTDQLHLVVTSPMGFGDDNQQCAPHEIAEAVVRLLRPMLPSGVDIGLALEDRPRVPMSAAALAQILINLVVNAKQALADWGSGRIQVKLTSLGEVVELHVCDNGPGIPDKLVDAVVEPGVSTRGQSGQGLSMVRRLAWASGADIELRNTHPGLTVVLRFPKRVPSDS